MQGPESTANPSNSVIWPELWTAFATHRRRVCELLRGLSSGPTSRLCVLGAGRTTDLDLIELAKHFGKIDLVDLEPTIISDALLQRGFDEHTNIRAIGGMDVTGLGALWSQFQESPSVQGLRAIVDACQKTKLKLDRYDVVASTCLLSQIIRHGFDAIEKSKLPQSVIQEYCPRLIRALREQHLELILDHTVSGGSALLVSDLTSAKALPAMLDSNADLSHLVSHDVAQGNHFHGLNPVSISESTRAPRIESKLAQLQMTAPWIWDSIESQYLCMAFRLKRK